MVEAMCLKFECFLVTDFIINLTIQFIPFAQNKFLNCMLPLLTYHFCDDDPNRVVRSNGFYAAVMV